MNGELGINVKPAQSAIERAAALVRSRVVEMLVKYRGVPYLRFRGLILYNPKPEYY
jgi:hypothetical protein